MNASRGNRSRVLILLPGSRYPQNAHLRQEAVALVGAGHDVSVICRRIEWREKQPLHEILEGVHVYRFPVPIFFRKFDFIGYIVAYAYALLATYLLSWYVFFRKGFDVIQIYNPPDVLVFIVIPFKVLGKRFVYDHRDLAPEMYHAIFGKGNRLIYATLVGLEKLCCRLADHIIAPNESYKKIEVERGGASPERISIVRSGTNLEVIRRVEPDPKLRAMGKVILCYVGAIGLHDGVDYLLRALQHLVIDLGRTDFYCVLVGGGKQGAEMMALSEQLSLTDYVHFTELIPHAEVARYLSSADICLSPEPSNSYNDRSTMIKINEYLAVGKPVVAFDLPEHRVTAGDAAVYARPNDELDFARKIACLMDNPPRRAEMGQIGRERTLSKLSWEHQVVNLLAAYESLAKV